MENYNYINIQGWMINELGLKDTELMIYSIIYGFAQTTDDSCNCSLNYFIKATSKSKNTVIDAIKSLIKKGLIFKEQIQTDKGKRNLYTINFDLVQNLQFASSKTELGGSSETEQGVVQNLNKGSSETELGGSSNSEPNNIYIYSNDKTIYKDIVEYLNLKAKTNFRYQGRKTQDLIKARLNEGFTLEDFKKVIDIKVNEWGNDKKMNKYLRPETLFSNKFEGYLNQKTIQKTERLTNNPFLNMLARGDLDE